MRTSYTPLKTVKLSVVTFYNNSCVVKHFLLDCALLKSQFNQPGVASFITEETKTNLVSRLMIKYNKKHRQVKMEDSRSNSAKSCRAYRTTYVDDLSHMGRWPMYMHEPCDPDHIPLLFFMHELGHSKSHHSHLFHWSHLCLPSLIPQIRMGAKAAVIVI